MKYNRWKAMWNDSRNMSIFNAEARRVVMTCNRCGSMMVYEKFYFHEDKFLGWRCIFCGEIVDQVILENRLAHRH